MIIKFLGHAAFLLISSSGVKIITDPYQSGSYGGAIKYKPINLEADVVTISHTQHPDHAYTKDIKGSPKIINNEESFEINGTRVKGLGSFHDQKQGRERGKNTIFVFEDAGLRLAHLGDLGHTLSKEQINSLGRIDVLLTPIGGFFTIGNGEVDTIVSDLKPKVVIPMHYKTDSCGFSVATIDEFLMGKTNFKKLDSSEVEISSKNLPKETEIYVLQHAL